MRIRLFTGPLKSLNRNISHYYFDSKPNNPFPINTVTTSDYAEGFKLYKNLYLGNLSIHIGGTFDANISRSRITHNEVYYYEQSPAEANILIEPMQAQRQLDIMNLIDQSE